MMRLFLSGMMLALGAIAVPALGADTLVWSSGGTWGPGDTLPTQRGEGLTVMLKIVPGYSNKNMDVVMTVMNSSTSPWCGAARLSKTQPDSTHFDLDVKAGGTSKWNEVMDRTDKIYLYLRRDDAGCK